MSDWAEPRDFNEWAKRAIGLRPILMLILVSSIFILELRFDWVERILGTYLATTNSERPESGAIWDKSRQARTAQQTLEKILTDRQSLQREARGAATFTQIAANVTSDNGVMLSADHFRQLYLRLPPSIAYEMISPFFISRIVSSCFAALMCCGIVFMYSDGDLLSITLNVKSSSGISFASTFLPHTAIFSEISFLAFSKSSTV